jgi:hypothetical protein
MPEDDLKARGRAPALRTLRADYEDMLATVAARRVTSAITLLAPVFAQFAITVKRKPRNEGWVLKQRGKQPLAVSLEGLAVRIEPVPVE